MHVTFPMRHQLFLLLHCLIASVVKSLPQNSDVLPEPAPPVDGMPVASYPVSFSDSAPDRVDSAFINQGSISYASIDADTNADSIDLDASGTLPPGSTNSDLSPDANLPIDDVDSTALAVKPHVNGPINRKLSANPEENKIYVCCPHHDDSTSGSDGSSQCPQSKFKWFYCMRSIMCSLSWLTKARSRNCQ